MMRIQVGEFISILFGYNTVRAKVVEDRGDLGVCGTQIVRVRGQDGSEFEVNAFRDAQRDDCKFAAGVLETAEEIILSGEITIYKARRLRQALDDIRSAYIKDPLFKYVLMRVISLTRTLETSAMCLDEEAIRQVAHEIWNTNWANLRLETPT